MAAICEFCGQDMGKSDGCTVDTLIFGDDTEHKRIAWGAAPGEEAVTWRCHDCNAEPGAYHHQNCDMERCPVCGGQMLSCECGRVVG